VAGRPNAFLELPRHILSRWIQDILAMVTSPGITNVPVTPLKLPRYVRVARWSAAVTSESLLIATWDNPDAAG